MKYERTKEYKQLKNIISVKNGFLINGKGHFSEEYFVLSKILSFRAISVLKR